MAGAMPITAASLPLPAGAATAAKQPALGVTGTPSNDVLSVQGITGMVPIKVDIAGTQQNVIAVKVDLTDTGSNSNVLLVDGSSVTQPVSGNVGITGSVAVTGTFWQATQPVSGTVTANAGTGTFATQHSNVTSDYDTGGGTQNITMWGLALPASGGAVIGGTAANPIRFDPTGTTTQPVSGTVTANAGTGTFNDQHSNITADYDTGGATQTMTMWGIALPASGGSVAGGTATNPIRTDPTGTTTQPISGTVAISGTAAVTQSGTWNVGTVTTVTTVTTVAAVTAITNALPAGTNLIGQVAAGQQVNALYNGATALTPKFAVISASASGATTVVAGVATKKIRVLRWSLSANGTVNAKWQSHSTPTDLTGLHYLTQYASAGAAYCPVGIFETLTGEALDINLSGTVAVGGELTYVEV